MRANYALFLLTITIFVFAFPIALIIYGFSGCDLRQRGDKHACRDGSADRCLAVGQFYEGRSNGFVSTMLSNPTTAINYYQRACKLGSVAGCAHFGHMKVVGNYDTIKDDSFTRADGIAALGSACDGGDSDSCHELGDALDPAQAAAVLDKLCKRGDKGSCDKLVTAVAATDPKAGVELAAKQCEAGNDAQCGDVGAGLLIGSGDEPARGAALLMKACDRGAWPRCTQLGQAYLDGIVPDDGSHATELFTKACTHDDTDACYWLGKVQLATDPAKAVETFTAECAHDPRGCDALGDIYRVGVEGIPRDRKRAYDYYEKMCSGGWDPGCYKMRCMNSDSDACYKLHQLFRDGGYQLGGKFDMR